MRDTGLTKQDFVAALLMISGNYTANSVWDDVIAIVGEGRGGESAFPQPVTNITLPPVGPHQACEISNGHSILTEQPFQWEVFNKAKHNDGKERLFWWENDKSPVVVRFIENIVYANSCYETSLGKQIFGTPAYVAELGEYPGEKT